MPMTPRELIVLLKHNGFEEVSQNGSHVKMKNLGWTKIARFTCSERSVFHEKIILSGNFS